MYAAIRQGQANPGAVQEVARRIQEGYIPILRNTPGFVAYYLVDTGNDAGLSITIFETQAQEEEFQQRANDWARQHLVPIMQGPPQPSTGEVLLHAVR
ncbi:MAG: hypothetical protein FJZ47_18205 [Candidatus Tectomicrobia bacterium]|uniref:ABM domain-containing protein n=1 Tax=Tectimicrobiota bacterium TaxID=2528274 RepID=A0A937W3V8_UNCTE|nr:hypothetical protein [Candidatus Tectomicrobia bacterium]